MDISRRFRLMVILIGILIAFFHTIIVGNATATIVGGIHDFSITGDGQNWGGATEQVCVFCHTPHAANFNQTYTTNPNTIGSSGSLGGQFLWNRALPANTFNVYTSETYTFKNSPPQPGINSLLCLSCHDGIGATSILINYPGDWDPSLVPSSSYNQFGDFDLSDPNVGPLNIGEAQCPGNSDTCTGGTELRNDHPIGFDYDTAQAADSELYPRTSLPAILQERLAKSNNRVECSTCHDPHMTNTTSMHNLFLVRPISGSQLCLDCHNK